MMTTDAPAGLGDGSAAATVQVARQPILATDDRQTLHGYELQFSGSGGLLDLFADVDDARATTEVVGHTVLTLGIDRVVGDALAFVRFPRSQVLDQAPLVLPPGRAVVVLGHDSWGEGDRDEIVRACASLRARGYAIALADVVADPALEPLLAVADYVSVDVSRKSEAALAAALAVVRRTGTAVIATHVDDEGHRDLVVRAGADYVQGFYFSAPGVVAGRELPGFKLSYLQLLRAAYADDVDFAALAEIVKRDVSLSYKLLKYVNSAHFGLRGEVTSVHHALTMLGLLQVRSWVGLATVSGLVHPRTQELAVLAATRARFCESLGHRLGVASAHECFALGMFSLLDVLLGKPMAEVLADVRLSPDVLAALQGDPGPLADLLGTIVAYERGAWDTVSRLCTTRGWPEADLIGLYIDAIEWSRDFFGVAGAQP
jgi:EAL and modified HD-GYP domain-containing signal transduction protein